VRQKAAARSLLWGDEAVVEDVENAMIKRGILPDSKLRNDLLAAWRAQGKKKRLPI
jgi:hypothetical protein